MARKSKTKVTPLPIFDVADAAIARMQMAVMYHTVKSFPLTREEFLECMIEPNVLSLLRGVGRHTRHWSSQTYQTFILSRVSYGPAYRPEETATFPVEVSVCYNHVALGIAAPRIDMPPNPNAPGWPYAHELFQDLARVAEKWENVWAVKGGLNKLGSMSRAKYLIPHFRNLMPADSPFHLATPREPRPQEVADAGLTAAMLREAVSTITEGILANSDQTIPERNVISVTVAVTNSGRKLPCGLF